MSGTYLIDVVIKEAGRLVDHFPNACRFDVSVTTEVALETANTGVVHVPATWDAEPGGDASIARGEFG